MENHGPFDLIFVDADHDYESVFRHSVVAFHQLATGGAILWHVYNHLSFLNGANGVLEAPYMAAKIFGRDILWIEGTTLAIYSEVSGWITSVIKG